MTGELAYHKDLVVLVPGKDDEQLLYGLFSRAGELKARDFSFDIHVHFHRDPGCLLGAHDFLRPQSKRYRHALVLFDRHGCGREKDSAEDLEKRVRSQLERSGWNDRAEVVVLDPELETWIWVRSPVVEKQLGWIDVDRSLWDWLEKEKHWPRDRAKPTDPKGAMEEAMRSARRIRSSSIYERIARNVDFLGCSDRAFRKLRKTLSEWYPAE